MRRIVCDTGPLICLREADLLSTLRAAGRLCVPPAVAEELKTFDGMPDWIQVIPVDDACLQQARAWARSGILDRGEAHAIALGNQLGTDWFLTDDAAARLIAQQEGLEVHGSLGVVLWAAATGRFDLEAARAALDALERSSLWLSTRILEKARAALPVLCDDQR